MRGRSLLPHFSGAEAKIHPEDAETGWELFGRRAIRRGSWKAVWLRTPEGSGGWQLYDLASDPGETSDRATDEPAILESLIAAWRRYVAEVGIVEGAVSVFEMD